jgi:hypothetical protein
VAPALRRIAAGQLDQPLLEVSLDLVRSWQLGPVVEGGFESLGDEALPQAFNADFHGPENNQSSDGCRG